MARTVFTGAVRRAGFLALCCFLLAAAHGRGESAQAKAAEKSEKAKQAVEAVSVTVYACPGHAGVRRDAPGSCPECGLALQEKQVTVYRLKDPSGGGARYTCPAHPDVKGKKNGRCPHDGTRLVREDMLN